MILVTGDWHLDDNADNEYRWQVIDHVFQAILQYTVSEVFILGDCWDRKDRHSAVLVNRTVDVFKQIAGRALLTILRGNHDTTLYDPAFWQFLNSFERIAYITKPRAWTPSLALLPHTTNPKQDWSGLHLSDFKALFMHVTFPGAVAENGQQLAGTKDLPIFRRSLKIYSGDVHTPQTLGNFTHVGAPHPIKYGDSYPCRMLLLDDDFEIAMELPIQGTRKHMLTISSASDLANLPVRHGDQVKIRFNLRGDGFDSWGQTEAAIAAWAQQRGITVASTEVLVNSMQRNLDTEQTPEQILSDFAVSERLTEDLLRTGLDLLRETQS